MKRRRQFLSTRNRRVATSAQTEYSVTILEIHPVRVVFGRDRKRRDDRVSDRSLQQLNAGVYVIRGAQRIGRLQQTNGLEMIPLLFEKSHGVLGHREHRRFVARQFDGSQKRGLKAAISSDFRNLRIFSAQNDARQAARRERGVGGISEQR